MDSTHTDRILSGRVAPFGNLRINGYLLLPAAYRSLSRPSSAPDAKAFPLRSLQLDLVERKLALPSGLSEKTWFSRIMQASQILKLLPFVLHLPRFPLPVSDKSPQFFRFQVPPPSIALPRSRQLPNPKAFLSVALLCFFSLFSFQGAHPVFPAKTSLGGEEYCSGALRFGLRNRSSAPNSVRID